MTSVYDSNIQKTIENLAEKLKPVLKTPEWAKFVKTSAGKERIPDKEYWHLRAASILRQVDLKGPLGTEKLKKKYGAKKNRGAKPEEFRKGSGKIIRTILKQLESEGLVKQATKESHKGRVITPKGKSLLDKSAVLKQ